MPPLTGFRAGVQELRHARLFDHPDRRNDAGTRHLQAVARQVEGKTGKSVEFFMPTSYASVIEGMVNGWVNIGVHGPNSYVLAKAKKDPDLEVFATYTKTKRSFPGRRSGLSRCADRCVDSKCYYLIRAMGCRPGRSGVDLRQPSAAHGVRRSREDRPWSWRNTSPRLSIQAATTSLRSPSRKAAWTTHSWPPIASRTM